MINVRINNFVGRLEAFYFSGWSSGCEYLIEFGLFGFREGYSLRFDFLNFYVIVSRKKNY